MKLIFLISSFVGFLAFASTGDASLKIVENSEVCMVNNTYFAKKQIPVKVGDNTYYGCCENCKKTLRDDSKSRAAIDPVSKKLVDKAQAVIASDNNGKVYYFTNKKNFTQFKKSK